MLTNLVAIYLDAHRGTDLSLAEELSIVFGVCTNAIVMVDDFQVPFDTGYGHDDYGPGRVLTAELIDPIVAAHSLQVFYPSTPSAEETGARRGCVVIASTSVALASLPLLRRIGYKNNLAPFRPIPFRACEIDRLPRTR